MVIGNPYKFSIFVKKIQEWSCNTYQNGVFLLCIDGNLFPKEIFTSTLTLDVLELKQNLSNVEVDKKLFEMKKEEAFVEMYRLRFPSWEEYEDGVKEDYRYYMSPPGLADYHCISFTVSDGKKVRIMAAKLNYNKEESTCELTNINISETFIECEELEKLLLKLEDSVCIAPKNEELSKIFDWSNPKSETTYGNTFIDHGEHFEISKLMIKAKNSGHQLGQWTNDQLAADFIAEIAQKRDVGTHNVTLPNDLPRRLFLATGIQDQADMARVIVNPDGSVQTAYPFNSHHPH